MVEREVTVTNHVNRSNLQLTQPSINREQKLGVLLIHGLSGAPSDLSFLKDYLENMGCIVETPTLIGHGLGEKKLSSTHWHEWVTDLKRCLDDLCRRCDGVVIGGVSMGAILAPLLAVDHPQVWGVVSISPVLRYDGRDLNSRLEFLLPLIDIFPGLREKYFASEALRISAWSLRQVQHLIRQLEIDAERLKCNALIMHGAEDSLTSGWNAKQLWSWFGSLDKEIYWISGDDHHLTMDLQRREVEEEFAKFATKISWLNSSPQLSRTSEVEVLSFLTDQRAIS
jgi:carboxylesterase